VLTTSSYLAGLGVNVGHGVLPPVLLEGLLLLALQGLGVVVLVHAVLGNTDTVRLDREPG